MRNKVRLFKTPSVFQSIYDWVDSLSLKSENFELLDFNESLLIPDAEVYSGTFNMVEVKEPVFMTPLGTVAFNGFDTTVQLMSKLIKLH